MARRNLTMTMRWKMNETEILMTLAPVLDRPVGVGCEKRRRRILYVKDMIDCDCIGARRSPRRFNICSATITWLELFCNRGPGGPRVRTAVRCLLNKLQEDPSPRLLLMLLAAHEAWKNGEFQ